MTQTGADAWADLGDAVWRADEVGGTPGATVASGHAALDAVLPGGGWPLEALTELLQPPGLHAEWLLLLPALVRLQQAGPGALVLVGPPHVPFGPALQAQGLAPQRLLCVQVLETQARLWAAEQALRCAGVQAVLAWLPQVRADHLRRLQVAAQAHHTPLFAIRPAPAQGESSPAVLRLLLSWPEAPAGPAQGGQPLCLQLLKRRGPPLMRRLQLPSQQGRLTAGLAGPVPVPAPEPAFGHGLGRDGEGHALDRLAATA